MKTKLKTFLAAALVAGAGVSAWAEDAPEEEVVAFGEAEFWLGGDEVVVASGEAAFWLGPGSETNPWEIGEGVEAWMDGTELVVQGAGTITDLSAIPAEVLGAIETITITEATVTGASDNAFAGFGADAAKVALTLPDGWQGELPDEDGNWYGAYVTLTAVPRSVRNVTFQQRYPWNGLVDIGFDLTGPEGETSVIVTVRDGETEVTNFTAAVTIPEDGVLTTNLVWDADAAGLAANFKSDDVTVEVAFEEDNTGPVQLWTGGPYFAQCNVGATRPEEYGILTNYNDAAQVVTDALGEGWRLPSDAELKILAGTNDGDKVCSNVWTTCNGVAGRRFFGMTSGYEDKSIFLPAAGFDDGYGREVAGDGGDYWSSEEDGDLAWGLCFDEGSADVYYYGRGSGLSVRAVRDTQPTPPEPEISAKSEAGALDLRTSVALAEGEVTVADVGYSDTAWGEEIAENVTLGYTNETTGATGVLKLALVGEDVAEIELPKKDGAYRLTHSTGALTSFATFTVTGYPTLKIPAAKTGYSYVVSNETGSAEITGELVDGTNNYTVAKGTKVKVYFTPDENYEWSGDFTNPKEIGPIESDTVIDASEMPKAVMVFVAEVTVGGETHQYTDFNEAWRAAHLLSNAETPATLKLLRNIHLTNTMETVTQQPE